MKCNEVKYYLNDYLDNLLPDEMREEIFIHLNSCGNCKHEFQKLNSLLEEARNLPKDILPNRDLWEGINERLGKAGKPRKKFSKIFSILGNSFHQDRTISNDSLQIKGKEKGRWVVAAVSLATVIIAVVIGFLYYTKSSTAFWEVKSIQGVPIAGSNEIKDHGTLEVGEWLVTDDSSKAKLKIGMIGEVEVDVKSRVHVVESKQTEYRIALSKGRIHATILAPPKLFFVETPSATAIDLGCMYTLEVDERGASFLHVTSGWVAFEFNHKESIVPAGAMCETDPSAGPGTPYFQDASSKFTNALYEIDFENAGDESLNILLSETRKKDLLSLWHLLQRKEKPERKLIFHKIAELTEIPANVNREGIINGNKEMLDVLWESLGYGSKSLWKL